MSLSALFLGYGRMGSALGEAWLDTGLVARIDAIDPHQQAPVRASIHRDAAGLPAGQPYDLLVLAVKPAMAREALQRLESSHLAGATLISVMAGVPIATLEAALPIALPIVRSMPNTPVMLRQGCTGLYGNPAVSPAIRARISPLFEAVGRAFWVEEESCLHAVTALSGSGPAYYHLFSEALANAGIKLGLSPELARQLAAQTALGAASLQTREGADFAALRQAVTSPNGTTHAAIEVFEHQHALRQLVDEAAAAAHRRSIELSRD